MAEEVVIDEELFAVLNGEESDEYQNSGVWKTDDVRLLIETRFSFEEQFTKGEKARSTLWNMIYKQMKTKNPNITVSVNELKKKFSNMLVTYNRIKKRNSKTGRDAIRWKYYEDFDKIFGSKHNIVPPVGLVIDSLDIENITPALSVDSSIASSNASTRISALDRAITHSNASDDTIGSRTPNKEYSTTASCSKRKKPGISLEMLKYWQEEDAKEKQRHDEYIAIEKEKNAIEKEKLSCLNEIKNILANLTNRDP